MTQQFLLVLLVLGLVCSQDSTHNFATNGVFQYAGCKSGLVNFLTAGFNLANVTLRNQQTGQLATNQLTGTTAAVVPPSQTLSTVQFLVPWQEFFTTYTATLQDTTGAIVGQLNFSCRDNVSPSPTLPGLPWTPIPDMTFGSFKSACYYNLSTISVVIQVQLVVYNFSITPSFIELVDGSQVLWTGQVYTFDPLVLRMSLPRSFDVSRPYQFNVFESDRSGARGRLLYTYKTAVLCAPDEYPFGYKTNPPPFKAALVNLGCQGGAWTFQVYGPGAVIQLIDKATNQPALNILTGKTKVLIPENYDSSPSPRTVRFFTPVENANTATYDVVLNWDSAKGGYEIARISAAQCKSISTSVPSSSNAVSYSYTSCNTTSLLAKFTVSGQPATKVVLRRARDGQLETNTLTRLQHQSFIDIPGDRFVNWQLPALTPMSEIYQVEISANGELKSSFRFNCCDGELL